MILTVPQRRALEHPALSPPAMRPVSQSHADWRFEHDSGWRFIPGAAATTHAQAFSVQK
jgi:hypothetical protein